MEIFTSCVSWWSVGKTVTEIRIQMTYVSPVHVHEISDALAGEATMQMCWEMQYRSILQILVGLLCSRYGMCGLFYTPPAGYYVIPSENFERLSVSALFPDSNLSSFWPIFFELCMDIDIGEEWFGIANGLNSFINNRVMALDWCKNVFFLNIFWTNGWILIKFCICIDKYKVHVVSNAHYFWSIFNRVMALDWRQNFVYDQYLVN